MQKTSGPKLTDRGNPHNVKSAASGRYRQTLSENQLDLPNLIAYPHRIENHALFEIPLANRPFAIAALTILVDRDHHVPLTKLRAMGFDTARLDRAKEELETLCRHTNDQEDRRITHGRLAQDSSPLERRRHNYASRRATSEQAQEISETSYPELCALWNLARKDVDVFLGIEAARRELIKEIQELRKSL
jgi:hypothetical protein